MTRKDTAQDLDRPHYYSQFWIDVASGKRDIAAGRVAEADAVEFDDLEDEEIEHEVEVPVAPVPVKAPVKAKAKAQDKKPEPVRPTITSLADLANIDLLMKNSAAMDGVDVPDIEAGAMDDLAPFSPEPAAAPIVTDFDVEKVKTEPVAAETDEFEDEFEDEEEEDEWGAPRKPGKQQKQPPRRRDRPTRF